MWSILARFHVLTDYIVVSGGAGAVGTTVGKAILESGGDVVFLDLVPSPSPEPWGKLQCIQYEVLLHMIRLMRNSEIIQDTARSNGTKALFQQLDVQDEVSITSAFSSIQPLLRHPIRGLVSCAAISGESDACDYPVNVFRRILDVNITGTFLIARAVAKEMHKAHVTGSIVLIASMSGHVSNKGINTSAYNASKAAVHQLARSLAQEWGHAQNTFPGSTASEANPNPSCEPRQRYA